MIFLLFPVFLLQLGVANLISFSAVFLEWISTFTSFLMSVVVGIIVSFSLLMNVETSIGYPLSDALHQTSAYIEQFQQKAAGSFPFLSKPATEPSEESLEVVRKNQVLEELSFWLKIEEQQPTHRDVLINISRLYQYVEKPEKATEYERKAKQVDPNFAGFKSEVSASQK